MFHAEKGHLTSRNPYGCSVNNHRCGYKQIWMAVLVKGVSSSIFAGVENVLGCIMRSTRLSGGVSALRERTTPINGAKDGLKTTVDTCVAHGCLSLSHVTSQQLFLENGCNFLESGNLLVDG